MMDTRRSIIICTASLIAGAVAGCTGSESSADDGSGSFDECPSDAEEAAAIVDEVDQSSTFELEQGGRPMEPSATVGEQTARGSNGTFSGPQDDPYRLSIDIWDDETVAENYADDLGWMLSQWRGEDIDLRAGIQARSEAVTFTVRSISEDQRDTLEEFYGLLSCVDEDHVTAVHPADKAPPEG